MNDKTYLSILLIVWGLLGISLFYFCTLENDIVLGISVLTIGTIFIFFLYYYGESFCNVGFNNLPKTVVIADINDTDFNEKEYPNQKYIQSITHDPIYQKQLYEVLKPHRKFTKDDTDKYREDFFNFRTHINNNSHYVDPVSRINEFYSNEDGMNIPCKQGETIWSLYSNLTKNEV